MKLQVEMGKFKDENVYISGPITGKLLANKAAFQGMEIWLVECGARVYNPRRHQVPKGLIECEIWPTMMRMALRDLVHCTSVVMLDGWKDSRGASLEHKIASELCMRIYDSKLKRIG